MGDPDAPDGTEEAEHQDGDEGFEEDDGDLQEEIDFLANHHDAADLLLPSEARGAPATAAVASTSQSGVTRTPPSQDDSAPGMEVQQAEEEEDDVLGPDGHGGYHHTVNLAKALVELRHQSFVTQRQTAEIIRLWQRLTDRDKAVVTFPPRFRDRLIQGRFKTTHRHSHVPGVESLKRAVLGQGRGAAQTPSASRLVEAVILELCRIHPHEACTIAGVRVQRWGAVMRDYNQIQQNICSSTALMASTRIQLYCVNQRTLTQWHNKRAKAMMRDTIALAIPGPSATSTAAEPLAAPRALMQQPQQPDQPLQHRLPEDASGLARTIRGPLAPELYARLLTTARVSSSSATTTPTATATATATPTATATATATPTTTATPTAILLTPPPPPTPTPPQACFSTPQLWTTLTLHPPQPSTSAAGTPQLWILTPPTPPPQPAGATSASSSSASTAPAAVASPSSPAIPRSTAWRRKIRQEEIRQAREKGLQVKDARRSSHFNCRHCGQPKTREYGHSRYKGEDFCSRVDGRTVEQWLAHKRQQDQGPLGRGRPL
ncbi:hypothetical protein ACEWY4_024015 [Coilia grayii]|uniref:Uncharacterized protein n=1 Tax=Coilia grayii TaxID=363190 RepID=A0ABD1IZ64_9TELE